MSETAATQPVTTTAARLGAFIARLENLDADIANLRADRREVVAEAKSLGYDTKAIEQVIKLRKIDKATREEMRSLGDIYLEAAERFAASKSASAPPVPASPSNPEHSEASAKECPQVPGMKGCL